jgi:hypothetical protein
MIGAYQLLKAYADRIVQLHVSEVDTLNRHDVISRAAEMAFSQIRQFVPKSAAVILEGRVLEKDIGREAEKVRLILDGNVQSEHAVEERQLARAMSVVSH